MEQNNLVENFFAPLKDIRDKELDLLCGQLTTMSDITKSTILTYISHFRKCNFYGPNKSVREDSLESRICLLKGLLQLQVLSFIDIENEKEVIKALNNEGEIYRSFYHNKRNYTHSFHDIYIR
mgnify:CR=1 FL=1